jgi:hypothetical protein
MGLIEFLFGKKPKINFEKDGSVRHDHTDKKWDDWKNRFSKNPDYNWRNHSGKSSGKNK